MSFQASFKALYITTSLWGLVFLVGISAGVSCSPASDPEWKFRSEIPLEGIGIIGIEFDASSDEFFISDGDNNRLLKVNREGEIIEEVETMRRPMHLSLRGDALFVAEYGADRIVVIAGEERFAVPLPQHPDSPAGVDALDDRLAVADFYGHRIILVAEEVDKTFGREGSGPGEFHYPTHVRFYGDNLYVADAYNHRVQVFDKDLNFLKMIGADDNIDAATGLYVDEDGVFVTDFENHRVLIYSHEGELQQILETGLKNPTAVVKKGDELFVANYHGNSIAVFTLTH